MLRSNTSSCTRVACRSCSRLKAALRSVEERDEQRVFAFGHRNVRAIRIGEPSGAKIELPAGKPIAAAFWLPRR